MKMKNEIETNEKHEIDYKSILVKNTTLTTGVRS